VVLVTQAAQALALLHLALAGGGFTAGFDSLRAGDLERDLTTLASPELEGRDTPSLGLERAARHIDERFRAAGLIAAPDSAQVYKEVGGRELPGAEPTAGPGTQVEGTYRRPWQRNLPTPDAASSLALVQGETRTAFVLGQDFVPVAGMEGQASGELVFAGYGIRAKSEKYDDLDGLKLRGKLALIVEGEPLHARAFEGPAVTESAALGRKIEALAQAGAAGVLVVRRAAPAEPEHAGEAPPTPAAPAEPAEPTLAFRHTWADWVGAPGDRPPKESLPVLELSPRAGTALLGEDVLELARRIDRSVRPVRSKQGARQVELVGRTRRESLAIDNVVGWVRGSELPDEFVVLGAHYDHIGVDARGRIGCGADDNASGTSALLEIAEGFASAGPRRSVYFCAFSGEEDGLLGSQAFCARLPVPREKIVAMVNLDMIGRGDAAEVAVLGIHQTPAFEKLLQRAKAQRSSGVQKIVMRQGEELFQRSDHYSFHQIGVPTLFFFEGLPIERNKDYHTWRDTLDLVDQDKVLRTTRLVYSTLWLLSNDDERPPRPRG